MNPNGLKWVHTGLNGSILPLPEKLTCPKNDPEDMDGELMGAWEEDGDAGKEGEEEVLHVDPLQLKPHMLAPLQ